MVENQNLAHNGNFSFIMGKGKEKDLTQEDQEKVVIVHEIRRTKTIVKTTTFETIIASNRDQNKNKTSTRPNVSHLKSSNQPDLVRHSVTRPTAQQEITRLEALCEARTKELNYLKIQLKKGIMGFDALSIMVRYLTEELDAFTCPSLKLTLKSTQEELTKAQATIDELRNDKSRLEDEIVALTKKHEEEVKVSNDDHHKEVEEIKEKMKEERETEVKRIVDQHSHEVTTLTSYHDRHVSEIKTECEKQVKDLEQQHTQNVEKLKEEHTKHIEELEKQHQERLEEVTNKFEEIKVSLLGKVESLMVECEEMQNKAREHQEALQKDSDVKVQLALAPFRNLPQEIDSLKTVVEMKNQEIHELRKQNLEQIKQLEELPVAREKIITLEQKIENLEAIINIKSDYEKQLSEKHQHLMRKFDKEYKVNKRLSMDNEELVWRLSQNDLSELAGSLPSPSGSFRRQVSRSPTSSEPGTPDFTRRRKSPLSCSPSNSDIALSPTHRSSHKRRSGSYASDGQSPQHRPESYHGSTTADEEKSDDRLQTL